ncbi:hypothetical protein FGAG_00711 [Fusobacterium gonidiaformans ATCC 25563]|uniref:redoxin family protein n=1 Tax=Fusobacterium gonidiaformans TaxID=849 RepID=UPI0001BC6474|nr:redoxin family protein [Fusobacterium gonidiaformans]EFS28390.1 hypothetical protein FGAG_00711 [Fusobacterium gonidiaformans ATCC 25563]
MKIWKKLLCSAMLVLGCSTAFAKGEDFSKIMLKDVAGKEYSFGKMKKPTYVKFWASWCPVCLSGLEEIDNLSKEKKDFEVVTVVFPGKKGEKSAVDFKEWYRSLEYKNVKVLLDEKGELLKLVNPRVYPTSVVLDASSKVQKVIPGHLAKAEIKSLFPMLKMDKKMDSKMMNDMMMKDNKMDKMMKDDKNMKMEKAGDSKNEKKRQCSN